MVEVVAPDKVFAVYRAFRGEGEGDGIAVVGVLRGGEVRRYGWRAFRVACNENLAKSTIFQEFRLLRRHAGCCRVPNDGLCTSVVLYADMYPRIEVLGGNVYGLLRIDVDILVLVCVVGCARRDFEDVLFVMGHRGGHFRLPGRYSEISTW